MVKMAHDKDPTKEIYEKLNGAHTDFDTFGTDVLLAIYQRPEKTAGGIYMGDNARGEDLYQGKVGLVLKVGPLVSGPDLDKWFAGKFPKVGDWVVVRVGDTYAFNLNGVPCRTVEAKQLRGRHKEPDMVW